MEVKVPLSRHQLRTASPAVQHHSGNESGAENFLDERNEPSLIEATLLRLALPPSLPPSFPRESRQCVIVVFLRHAVSAGGGTGLF